ncbi:enhancer of split mgamma protein [Apis mellifera carnica]|uniref:Enhancer of split mgamma protein n=1 Tax=Apis mellifera TaxID=7460 RepID=A0A7M7GB43_APIME|nr:enhancer of split mgamma protein [Apis mellifera]XP_006559350.2 enhancer of split mgamma protein [Apis mellifera]XP_006559351.2 enhancer of split mgamma protein [Apis mellifera]XP_006559352.2 enhancer of split mgamma protein [Apis mellifera]XP_006559353.2 enhancer of split mgamma protein [Apis mellifera]XP_006559354.2 enhancer of split mgamma protein [Apis mellifera]KAG9429705.1 enhancer of split mgamma protein [Apis mellifera carnica]|eukprot:XP_003249471.2 enhancer of split mgamma protein [Apis mellifera]
MMSYEFPHPVSKTYRYKKITKPLLERKRRARINKCLDELKNLMIDALETEGEDISKLEKADILELTVRHLQRLQGSRSSTGHLPDTATKSGEVSGENRWLSGFGHCAAEAYRFLSAVPGEGAERLARHLAAGLQKSRQTNSTLKTNVLTQTLASLDLTADLLASSIPIDKSASPNQNAITYRGRIPDAVTFNIPSGCNSGTNVENGEKLERGCVSEMSRDSKEGQTEEKVKIEIKVEDEEEIDVERVDDVDPMWRPW